MKRDLPNLHALKAFEAAARLGSFKLASQELHVTPTAVSHHIRRLEERIGVQLFTRSTRQVTLTEKGDKLMRACSAAFDIIEATTAEIAKASDRLVVSIAVGPSFAARWLTPRLSQFWQDFPNVELRLTRMPAEENIAETKSDFLLLWGPRNWSDREAQLILPVRAVPVASPDLVERLGMPTDAEDVLHFPLLHYRNRDEWNKWFQNAGLSGTSDRVGMIIDDENVVFRGAIEGQGAAIGWSPLIDDDIGNGRLVPLSRIASPQLRGYYLIVNKQQSSPPLLDEIVQWFVRQGAATAASRLG